MEQTRRTMAAALQMPSLPPEAVAIIKEGTPKPQTQNPVLSNPAPTKTERDREPQIEESKPTEVRAPVSSSRTRNPKEQVAEPTVALVSMNSRVPANIPPALMRASVDRKIRKIRPFTQQEIVAEALSDWLRKHGYIQ